MSLSHVWLVNDGEKVKRGDLTNPNRGQNSVWNGERGTLFGARNEIVAFQVLLESDSSGAEAVEVGLAELVHRESGHRLIFLPEPEDPTDTRGRQIERFTEHYLHIEKPSPPAWFYAPTAAPNDPTGWIPDALIPSNARPGRGGMPFDIAPNANQGVWFDIAIPKTGTPAGIYEGHVRVYEGGRLVREIPLSLRVFDFALPDAPPLHTMLYFEESSLAARHGINSAAVLARYHRFAHRHRVEFTDAYSPKSDSLHLDLLTGNAFTAERGYEGPGAGQGNIVVPASFYGMRPAWQSDQEWALADAFVAWVQRARPEALSFLYVTDEPPPSRFPWIAETGKKHHQNPGPGGRLATFLTHPPHPDLEGAIDIWCTVTNQYDIAAAREEKAKGRRWWVYNGYRPAAGIQLTDAPATDSRVTPWACWKHDIELWFYWHVNHWRHNSQTQRGEQNVWADPVTFGYDGEFNGDGVLIYPGEDVLFPEQDRGIAGPIASIRFKNLRRGLQDVAYLRLAEEKGLHALAKEVATRCVPAVLSEAGETISWSERGSDWDAERLRLAEGIERAVAHP